MKRPRRGWLIASALVLTVGVLQITLAPTLSPYEAGSSTALELRLWEIVPYGLVAGLLFLLHRRPRARDLAVDDPTRSRRGIISAVVLGVVVVGGLAVLWQFQRTLIYYPDPTDPGHLSERIEGGQDAILRTADGLTLNAWLVRPSVTDRHVAIIYLPGNGGNRRDRLDLATAVADEGYTVLLVDYRGYGGNPGEPSEDGLARDAAAAATYLAGHGFPADRTMYVGESIGTGVAARLAETNPPAAVLLRSPYTSLDDVAHRHVPWLPTHLILRDHFDTLAHLPHLTCPVMVVAGDADTLVPLEQSRYVSAHTPHLYREVVEPGAGHNDPRWFDSTLARMIDELAQGTVGRS